MGLNAILEVAITLAFLFSLLSILVSSINEFIMYVSKKRGKFLYWALEEVFKDTVRNKNYAALLLRNPLIDRLRKDSKTLPAYIGATQFSEALIDVMCEEYDNHKYVYSPTPDANGEYELVAAAPIVSDSFSKFKVSVDMMHNSDLKKLLNSFLNGTNDYDKLKTNIQNWYHDYMERVSGWYKTHLQQIIFFISLGIAIAMNVNSIKVVSHLSQDKTLREQLSSAAEHYVEAKMKASARDSVAAVDSTYKQVVNTIKSMNDSITSLGFPIGWDWMSIQKEIPRVSKSLSKADYAKEALNVGWELFVTLVGWLITAIAISFGAPFWFDLLSKLVNLRRTGPKPSNTIKL